MNRYASTHNASNSKYQVPIWQALAKAGQVPFEVCPTDHGTNPSLDTQFGKTFAWDIDMLSGYPYRCIKTEEGESDHALGNVVCASRYASGYFNRVSRRFGFKDGKSLAIGSRSARRKQLVQKCG